MQIFRRLWHRPARSRRSVRRRRGWRKGRADERLRGVPSNCRWHVCDSAYRYDLLVVIPIPTRSPMCPAGHHNTVQSCQNDGCPITAESCCELRLSEFDDVRSPATSSYAFLKSLEGVTFVNTPLLWWRCSQRRVILTVRLRPFDRAAAALCMQSRGPDLQEIAF